MVFPLSWILYPGSGEHWSFKAHKPCVTKLCFSDSTLQRRKTVQCLPMPSLSPRSRRDSHCCSPTWLPSDQASPARVWDISKSLLQSHLKSEQTWSRRDHYQLLDPKSQQHLHSTEGRSVGVEPNSILKIKYLFMPKAQLTTQWSRILSPGIPNAVQYFKVSRKVSDSHAIFFFSPGEVLLHLKVCYNTFIKKKQIENLLLLLI